MKKSLKIASALFISTSILASCLSSLAATAYPYYTPYYPYAPYAPYSTVNPYENPAVVEGYLASYYNNPYYYNSEAYNNGTYNTPAYEDFFGVRIPKATLVMANINTHVQDIWISGINQETAELNVLPTLSVNADRLPFTQSITKSPNLRLTLNTLKDSSYGYATGMMLNSKALNNLDKAGIKELAFTTPSGDAKAIVNVSDLLDDYNAISTKIDTEISDFDLYIQITPYKIDLEYSSSIAYDFRLFALTKTQKIDANEIASQISIEIITSGLSAKSRIASVSMDGQIEKYVDRIKTLNATKNQTRFFASVYPGIYCVIEK